MFSSSSALGLALGSSRSRGAWKGKKWGGSGWEKMGGEWWEVGEGPWRRKVALKLHTGALGLSPVHWERAQDGTGPGKEGEWAGSWPPWHLVEYPEDPGGKSSLHGSGSEPPTFAGVGASGEVGTGQSHSVGSLRGCLQVTCLCLSLGYASIRCYHPRPGQS